MRRFLLVFLVLSASSAVAAERDYGPDLQAFLSREGLKSLPEPIALALGLAPSGGLAPVFFRRELERSPADFDGILGGFEDYKAFAVAEDRKANGEWMKELTARQAEKIERRIRELRASGRFDSAAELAPVLETRRTDVLHSFAYSRFYRQKGYQKDDLQGDVSLAEFTRHVPEHIALVTLKLGSVPLDPRPRYVSEDGRDLNPVLPPKAEAGPAAAGRKGDAEVRNAALSIEGRLDPLRVPEMTRMFEQVLADEASAGLAPKAGTPHAWSPEFLARYRKLEDYRPIARFPKLLVALASGVSSRFLVTGQELPLLRWILERADESVQVHELFRESYRLNEGDVYLALLTAENVLSSYWRSPSRGERAVTRKLAPITNNYRDRGNKFGAWYHLFGIMLYSYAEDGGSWVALIERLGSHVMSADLGPQQSDSINRDGAELGQKLRAIVQEGSWRVPRPEGTDPTDPKAYLDRGEDFRDREYMADDREFIAEIEGSDLSLRSLHAGRTGCAVEVMSDDGFGVDSRRTARYEGVGFARGMTVRLRAPHREPRDIRAFIRCSGGFTAAVCAARPGRMAERCLR